MIEYYILVIQIHVNSKINIFIGYLTFPATGVSYSEVRTFMKRQPTVTTMYKSITTSCNNTINLSRDHLIYARKSRTDEFTPM